MWLHLWKFCGALGGDAKERRNDEKWKKGDKHHEKPISRTGGMDVVSTNRGRLKLNKSRTCHEPSPSRPFWHGYEAEGPVYQRSRQWPLEVVAPGISLAQHGSTTSALIAMTSETSSRSLCKDCHEGGKLEPQVVWRSHDHTEGLGPNGPHLPHGPSGLPHAYELPYCRWPWCTLIITFGG